MNSELQSFVRDALARGIPRERIRAELTAAGWPADEIEAALAAWAESELPIPVPRRRPYVSAREAFQYLVLFAMLYVVAFHAGALLFTIIDWRWPDPARGEANRLMAAANARFSTAALVIAFPILLYVSAAIGRAVRLDPEKRASKIRKWLTYLTLFLAALVLIGDLIALMRAVLAGELGVRFVLKVAGVFAIAGVVFGHYLGDLRREEAAAAGAGVLGLLARVGAAGVALVIATGLWFSGSPHQERLRQLDQRRVEELRQLATAIDVYTAETGRPPARLDDVLTYRNSHVRTARDPATGAPYGYVALDTLRYQLCATFDRADTATFAETLGQESRFWDHPAGHACFTLVAPKDAVPTEKRRP